MIYYQKVKINNENIIAERYQPVIDIFSNNPIGTKLPKNQYDWIGQQLREDLFKITGKLHEVRTAYIFTQEGNFKQDIHIDSPNSTWALNIPLLNCGSAEMSWYGGEHDRKQYTELGILFSRLTWKEEPIKLASVFLDSPAFVRVDYPHSVENFSPNIRALLSVRFIPELF